LSICGTANISTVSQLYVIPEHHEFRTNGASNLSVELEERASQQ
jgi:hypothetical protein